MKMKSMLVLLAALAIPTIAFAQAMPMMAGRGHGTGDFEARAFMHRDSYLSAEIKSIETELGDKPLGELTVNQLLPYGERLRLAGRKDVYVARSAMASLRIPGAGQFRNGDAAGGTAFLAAHIATVAGALVGEYFLLPANLRFDKLNYLKSSLSDIGSAWAGHSVVDYLPSLGVALAGCLVDGGIRIWSASSAYGEAKAAVDSGRARLEPSLGPGFMGMMMRY